MLSLVGQAEEDSLIDKTPLHMGDDTLRFSETEPQQEWSQVAIKSPAAATTLTACVSKM